ncbi:hypothetical protein V8C26DRAFT_242805 [Trichoderma gracile]
MLDVLVQEQRGNDGMWSNYKLLLLLLLLLLYHSRYVSSVQVSCMEYFAHSHDSTTQTIVVTGCQDSRVGAPSASRYGVRG